MIKAAVGRDPGAPVGTDRGAGPQRKPSPGVLARKVD